jgi:hypothetical protein
MLIANGWLKTVAFIVISPVLGLLLGGLLMLAVNWLCRSQTPARVRRVFRKLQLLSAALYSLGHGGNDAQRRWASLQASWLRRISILRRQPEFQSGLCWRVTRRWAWGVFPVDGESSGLWDIGSRV